MGPNANALTPFQLCIRDNVRARFGLEKTPQLSSFGTRPTENVQRPLKAARLQEVKGWFALSPEELPRELKLKSPEYKVALLLDIETADAAKQIHYQFSTPAVQEALADLRDHLTSEQRIALLRSPQLRIVAAKKASLSNGTLIDRVIDSVAGLRIEQTEKSNTVADLPSAAGPAQWSTNFTTGKFRKPDNSAVYGYLTPYADIERGLELVNIQKGQTICDLGSAYGRHGIVVGMNHPENKIIGLEISPTRVREAQRVQKDLKLHNVEIREQDLSAPDFKLPIADVYFLYNPVNGKTLSLLLNQFKQMAKDGHKFKIVGREGGGLFIDKLAAGTKGWFKDWAKLIYFDKGVSPDSLHYDEHTVIYESITP